MALAERRMFAKTIIDSDAFLEMPVTAQLLYFHLAMRGDDDGFINKPKAIMRICGAHDDDLRVLFAKKFIIPFESGVVVIKHWRIHNLIRTDRYVETKYIEEKATLYLDKLGAYTQSEDKANALPPTKESNGHPIELDLGKPLVNQRLTEVSIGKYSIVKDNIKRENTKREKAELSSPTLEEIKEYGRSVNREDIAKKFYDYYSAAGWKDTGGRKIHNWQAKYIAWCNREPKEERVRYGEFDPTEAFEAAVKRSMENG